MKKGPLREQIKVPQQDGLHINSSVDYKFCIRSQSANQADRPVWSFKEEQQSFLLSAAA